MARERREALRVDVPTLEPDPVFLARLSALSRSSAPAPRAVRRHGVRALAAAATVAVVGTTSWAAGALPGTDDAPASPAREITTAPTELSSPGGVGSPQPDDAFSPGGPLSPGPPGEHSTSADDRTPPAERRGAPRQPGEQPPRANPGKGDGTGNGHGRGHAHGHHRSPGPPDHAVADPPGLGNGLGKGLAKGHDKAPGQNQDKDGDKGKGKGHDKGSPPRGNGRR